MAGILPDGFAAEGAARKVGCRLRGGRGVYRRLGRLPSRAGAVRRSLLFWRSCLAERVRGAVRPAQEAVAKDRRSVRMLGSAGRGARVGF
jgi:hypothetical protein